MVGDYVSHFSWFSWEQGRFLAGQAKIEGENDLKATEDVKSQYVEGD